MAALTLMIAAGLAVSVAAAPPLSAQTDTPAACPASPLVHTAGGPGAFRLLGELPRALHHLTVLRSVGGCEMATVKVGQETYVLPTGQRSGFTPADGRARRQR